MNEFDLSAWWAQLLAFAAGVVAFASPVRVADRAGLPILRHGIGRRQQFVGSAGRSDARRQAVPMLLVVAGFAVVFTSLGAFAGLFAPVVRSTAGQRVAGVVVAAVGVFLVMYAVRAGPASMFGERRPFLDKIRPGGVAAFPLGDGLRRGMDPVYRAGAAGTLALATTQSDPIRSAVLLFAFSMGLGLPFVLIGLGVGGLMSRLGVLQRHYRAIAGVAGSILVVIGLLLVSGLWFRLLAPVLRLVTSYEPPI